MAVKFEFYLSDEYFDRMAVTKKQQHKDNLTYNEFAKELLQDKIYELHPTKPTEEELEEC